MKDENGELAVAMQQIQSLIEVAKLQAQALAFVVDRERPRKDRAEKVLELFRDKPGDHVDHVEAKAIVRPQRRPQAVSNTVPTLTDVQLGTFLAAWRAALNGAAWRVRGVCEHLSRRRDDEPGIVLRHVFEACQNKPNLLGILLRKHMGRVAGGLRLVRGGIRGGFRTWMVEVVTTRTTSSVDDGSANRVSKNGTRG